MGKGKSMKKFRVTITETLSTSVEVEAEDEFDAEDKVQKRYNNSDIILTAEDYVDTKFSTTEIKSEDCA